MSANPSLARQIADDFLTVGRLPLLLLIFVMLTALSVVYITQKTRAVVANHDKLLIERDRLDVEWRNLQLEEYALSEHSRIETIARDELNMLRPDSKHEIIVSQ